jgi:hypothetical protein
MKTIVEQMSDEIVLPLVVPYDGLNKYISISLYDAPYTTKEERQYAYIQGLFASKEVFEELLPDFKVRIYIHSQIDQRLKNVFMKWKWELIECYFIGEGDNVTPQGAMWRYDALWDDHIDVCVFADADCPITYSDAYNIRHFLESDKDVLAQTYSIFSYEKMNRPWAECGRICVKTNRGQLMHEVDKRGIAKAKFFDLIKNAGYGTDENWLNQTFLPLVWDRLTWLIDAPQPEFSLHDDPVYQQRKSCPPPVDSVYVRHNLALFYKNHSYLWDMYDWYQDWNELYQIRFNEHAKIELEGYGMKTSLSHTLHGDTYH